MKAARSLPDAFRPLLWSYDFEKVDAAASRKLIIIQAINYGTLGHWSWIAQHYGLAAVQETLTSISASELRPRVRRLAALLFKFDHFNYAPRGSH